MAGGSSSHSTRGIDIDSTKDSRWNGVNMQSDFLGLILVAQGAITREDLFAGLRRQTQSGEMLGQALIELGVLSEDALATAVAVQVGAPLFDADWLVVELPELPCEVPQELDIKILHCAEGVEVWGVRTPAGRIWLEERASSFEGQLGVYVLPDSLWEVVPARPEDALEESVPTEEDDGPLQMHTAIEGFYEATDFSGLARTLSRGLGDMFSSVSAALEGPSGFEQLWMNDEGLEVQRFESGESAEGWLIAEASAGLKSDVAPHGWRLQFGSQAPDNLVIYVFDQAIDDPMVLDELTREFESAHKLLMERVISG